MRTTSESAAKLCARDIRRFAWLCDSEADITRFSSSAFDSSARSAPRRFGTMVTWGTSPEMVVPVDACVPDPSLELDPVRRDGRMRALAYMGLEPGTKIRDIRPDKVFIGSCTNARI